MTSTEPAPRLCLCGQCITCLSTDGYCSSASWLRRLYSSSVIHRTDPVFTFRIVNRPQSPCDTHVPRCLLCPFTS